MKKIIIMLIFACTLLAVSKSNKTALTGKIINEYGLTEGDIKKIQFYILDDIVLTKEAKTQKLNKGKKFKKINTVSVDEIFIEQNTPCVVTKFSTDSLWVSFDKNRTFIFTKPSKNGTFSLAGIKTEVGYNVFFNKKIYSMKPYTFVALYFDFSVEKIVNKKRTQIKGRTLKN